MSRHERLPPGATASDDDVLVTADEKPRRAGISVEYTDPQHVNVQVVGTVDQFAEVFGTVDWPFQREMVDQIIALVGGSGDGTKDERAAAGYLAMVGGVRPEDAVEGMLAVQMAAVQTATMRFAERLRHAKSVEHVESYERSLNRLARTFAAQMEALKRYRSRGEQRVVVEHQHVHVYPGGQAVVGNVTAGVGRGSDETGGQPHEIVDGLLLPERAAVLGAIEANGLPVQGSSGEGQERLPLPRGARRAKVGAGQ